MSKCRYNLLEDCNNTNCLTCVLDKIRAEIMKLQTYKMFEGEDAVYVECEDVLQIIDKHTSGKESE